MATEATVDTEARARLHAKIARKPDRLTTKHPIGRPFTNLNENN
jgi:hypothetical protein